MKKVYVLEVFRPISFYEEMLSEVEAGFDALTPDLKIKFKDFFEDLFGKIFGKLAAAKHHGRGLWEGVIGRTSLETLQKDGYNSWLQNPKDAYRVVEGEIEDDATIWVGYQRTKYMVKAGKALLVDYCYRMINNN